MKIIVGLGNPGSKYEGTRHNIGFEAIDRMAGSHDISLRQRIGRSFVGTGKIGSQEAVLAKPQTYMNQSGVAVHSLLSHFQEDASQLVVVHDDLDLEFGRLRIKTRGGHGGHKGIESIRASIGTDRFVRIKIGIGRPTGEAKDYVLNGFDREEKKRLGEILDRVADAAALIADGDVERAMNRFN